MELIGTAWSRIQHQGLKGASVMDLLAVSLSREEKDLEANEGVARDLMKRYSLAHLTDLAPVDLLNASGLEAYESGRILAAIELGRRSAGTGKQLVTTISNSTEAYNAFAWLENESKEHFCCAMLNAKGGVIAIRTIHIGTLTMSIVGPREVFREAIRENASSIILAHNHPSGDPTPSPEDYAITKKLVALGEELDLPVLDHIVIGHGRFVSMNQEGKL